jgi:hypothetical protein
VIHDAANGISGAAIEPQPIANSCNKWHTYHPESAYTPTRTKAVQCQIPIAKETLSADHQSGSHQGRGAPEDPHGLTNGPPVPGAVLEASRIFGGSEGAGRPATAAPSRGIPLGLPIVEAEGPGGFTVRCPANELKSLVPSIRCFGVADEMQGDGMLERLWLLTVAPGTFQTPCAS